MRTRLVLVLAGLFLLTAAACSSGEPATAVPGAETGTLSGSVNIGPLCPVEPCSTQVGDTYSSRQLQIQGELDGDSSDGIVVSLDRDGAFNTLLPIGHYVVDLTDCDFLGCAVFLPVEIEIVAGETYELNINIDTGIRSVVRPPMDLEQLTADLRNAGEDVEEGGDVTQPFLDVPGRTVTVNGAGIQVFEYPSFEDAQAAAAGIGPDGSTIGTTSVMWVAPPHFYSSGMLIVLYVGDDDDLRHLLESVLGDQIAGGGPVALLTPNTPDVGRDADAAARRELSARLGVAPEDLELVHSISLEFNDGSIGCPEPGYAYTMAIIPGYVLLYEVEGTRYPFHVSADGRIYTDCRGENNVAAPFRVADDFVRVRDAFEWNGGGPSHLGPEVVLRTKAEAEAYLGNSNGLEEIDLGLVDWEAEMLVGTVITGSGCSFETVTPLVLMEHLGKTVVVHVEAEQTGLCEKAWAQPVWLVLKDVPKDYSASFVLSYSEN